MTLNFIEYKLCNYTKIKEIPLVTWHRRFYCFSFVYLNFDAVKSLALIWLTQLTHLISWALSNWFFYFFCCCTATPLTQVRVELSPLNEFYVDILCTLSMPLIFFPGELFYSCSGSFIACWKPYGDLYFQTFYVILSLEESCLISNHTLSSYSFTNSRNSGFFLRNRW